MPSANNVARARSYVIFETSFFATSILQGHFYNVILIRRIILILRFGKTTGIDHIAVLADSNKNVYCHGSNMESPRD